MAATVLIVADKLHADPYQPIDLPESKFKPVRISGAVKSNGKGISNVAVTDGLSVVKTKSDGSFEMLSNTMQRFVYITIPSGYQIPKSKTGTALFYREIKPDKLNEMNAVFELSKTENDVNHKFLVMADPQTQDNEDVNLLHTVAQPDLVKTCKKFSDEPVFGLANGDIMFDRLEYYPDYLKTVKAMGIPCFQVLGNHDVEVEAKTDETSVGTFQDYFGPAYYSFNKGDVHYVVLDDIFWFGGYIGYLDQKQLDWLKQDLAFVEKGKTVVVFCHIPVLCSQHIRYEQERPRDSVVIVNRELLYKILEPYKSYVISGHTHESDYLREGGSEIHVCGALCGAWWTGPICFDGTPMGYSIYTVKGSELTWQYKSTGKEIDHQMRVYNPFKNNGELIANVYSANDKWKVFWYEDGMKKGLMNNKVMNDPLSVKLHEGDKLPKKRPWVNPVKNNHMFTASPSKGIKEIVVEAIDDWGRIYKETITL
jgi:hypothetical protein